MTVAIEGHELNKVGYVLWYFFLLSLFSYVFVAGMACGTQVRINKIIILLWILTIVMITSFGVISLFPNKITKKEEFQDEDRNS
ncbi:MAG: hypothetical protein ACFFAS_20395 [Promethearchaeota archaeon]